MPSVGGLGCISTFLSYNFATIVGPGWVMGSLEAMNGIRKPESIVAGKYFSAFFLRLIASSSANALSTVTQSHVHYISYSSVEEIERTNPTLVLQLYKLLSYLMTKRQQVTISQLGTFHSIMSAPALKKPIGRSRLSSFYE
jgi:hypothetical protein